MEKKKMTENEKLQKLLVVLTDVLKRTMDELNDDKEFNLSETDFTLIIDNDEGFVISSSMLNPGNIANLLGYAKKAISEKIRELRLHHKSKVH